MKRSVQFENIRVSYTVRGSGRPVVLLHGYLETLRGMGSLSEMLEEKFRIIAAGSAGSR
jgi:hypothetical protein